MGHTVTSASATDLSDHDVVKSAVKVTPEVYAVCFFCSGHYHDDQLCEQRCSGS